MMVQKSGPRRNSSSAKQSQGQKVRSVIKGNVPNNSIVEDKYYEGTGQRKTMKYLRESCYHHIKGSAANSLVAFMWRRPLNSVALTAPTHRGLERVFDGISTQ